MNAPTTKVALIGTQRVGKTSLLTKFHFGTFEKNTVATIGASFLLHHFIIKGKDYSFQIWDTAGQERYRSLGPIYYRDAACALAIFDLSIPDSFEEMKVYVNQFKTHCSNYVHIAVVGNKLDLYKEKGGIDLEEVEKYCTCEGFTFHKTSALSGEGVNKMFQDVAELVVERQAGSSMSGVDLQEKNEKTRCCN